MLSRALEDGLREPHSHEQNHDTAGGLEKGEAPKADLIPLRRPPMIYGAKLTALPRRVRRALSMFKLVLTVGTEVEQIEKIADGRRIDRHIRIVRDRDRVGEIVPAAG
jgi:hypothetical protein